MTIYSGTVSHRVYITDRDRIEPGTAFASWVRVSDCPAFTGFPEGTAFASSVQVINCPAFTGFPEGTAFASSVEVINCPAFTGFPEGTAFASSVEVINCPAFTGFPEGTAFASSVQVINCPAFTGSAGCTFKGQPIAFGDEADARIKRIATIVANTPTALKMDKWHSCNTTHCLAGWGVHLEGAAGYALERELGSNGEHDTAGAGLVLLGLEAAGKFYQTTAEGDREVRAWLNSKLIAA